MELSLFIPALLMTVVEGAAVMIGLFFTLYKQLQNTKFISFVFSFSGGMMLFAAFVKFYPSALAIFEAEYSYKSALLLSGIAFFCGLLITAPLDILISRKQNTKTKPHIECHNRTKQENHIYVLLLSSLIFHNFLEGIATYISFFDGKNIAFIVVASLVAHNIPEGAIISLLVYRKTKSRMKAMKFCLLAGLSGPLGAIVTALVLPIDLSIEYLGFIKAALAGILVNTALVELILPSAYVFKKQHVSKKGIVLGMLFMYVLLIIY
ncbi:MAG: ZIP family metal transporter [Bacteroidales bacterium]